MIFSLFNNHINSQQGMYEKVANLFCRWQYLGWSMMQIAVKTNPFVWTLEMLFGSMLLRRTSNEPSSDEMT